MKSDKYCEWYCLECIDKGEWRWITDCKHEFIMTRNNKYGKIHKEAVQPNATTKCCFCGKEINIFCYD